MCAPRRFARLHFAFYRHAGGAIYWNEGSPWENPTGISGGTRVLKLFVNAQRKVEYVVDGTTIRTSTADAWAGGDQLSLGRDGPQQPQLLRLPVA